MRLQNHPSSPIHHPIFLTVAVTVLLCVTTATPDTVYTSSGKTYKGTVRKDGNFVVVETKEGQQVRLPKEDVIHIARSETRPQPETKVKSNQSSSPTPVQPHPTNQQVTDYGSFELPETFAFAYMRNLSAASPGPEAVDARKNMELWQRRAHKKMRKAGHKWLPLEEFSRPRKKAIEFFGKASEEASEARPRRNHRRSANLKPSPRQRKHRQTAMNLYQKGSQIWPDSVLRNYLLGLTYIQAEEPKKACSLLDRCIDSMPNIAGFLQARAIARIESGKAQEALQDAMEVLRLKPDSMTAVHLLRQIMDKTPADEIQSEVFLQAKKLSDKYPIIRRRYQPRIPKTEWLMPGGKKDWNAYVDTVPVPPYDRLIVLQGVAYATGPHTLLVDRKLLDDALELHVLIGDNQVVLADIAHLDKRQDSVDSPQLGLITIPGYVFSSAPGQSEEISPSVGTVCNGHAANLLPSMGRNIRLIEGRLRKDSQGSLVPSFTLLAGETASPVLDKDGKLLGVLAGKTDVFKLNGGSDLFWNQEDLKNILRRAKRYKPRKNPRRSYKTISLEEENKSVSKRLFMVWALKGEKAE